MLFDFHFHLLFKHYIHNSKITLSQNVKTTGIAHLLNGLFGGPFDSQSSPAIVGNSPLKVGVVSISSLEHAFTNRILHVFGLNLSKNLPINQKMFERIRESRTNYYTEFKDQIDFYMANKEALSKAPFNMEFLSRKNFKGKTVAQIEALLSAGNKKFMAFSIEGGHNFSNVPVRSETQPSQFPELQLKEIQDSSPIDFMCSNLCHLSEIPEQSLGGFAQGLNKLSQLAFKSDDFMPKKGFGVSELGKKVIRQALLHKDSPMLVDVKHMSLYTRLHFYRLRDKLNAEHPETERLPIISSHCGFTFTNVTDYVQNKRFRSTTGTEHAQPFSIVEPENLKIGRTNDLVNKGLFCNRWTINLFDEDIVEIMESRGLIGISLDQRILGTSNPAMDSFRDKYYEGEYVPYAEWQKLFRDGQLPGVEKLGIFESLAPSAKERHIMLLCLHIVYAVRIGYEHVAWIGDDSPWDCICIGSDFDGLINPINGFDNTADLKGLQKQLKKYLPQADKYLKVGSGRKAFEYDDNDNLVEASLNKGIEKFLFKSGLRFTARFLSNWVE